MCSVHQQAAISACSRHVPRDSPLYMRFFRSVKHITRVVAHPTPAASDGNQPAAGGGGVQLGAQVQMDVTKTMSLPTLQRNGVLNLDEALLVAHRMWASELEWRRLHNLAACCRASVHWQNRTWKSVEAKVTLPHVAVLSSFQISTNKRSKVTKGDVSQLTGVEHVGASLVGLDSDRVVQLLASQMSQSKLVTATSGGTSTEGAEGDGEKATGVAKVAGSETDELQSLSTPRKVSLANNTEYLALDLSFGPC
jgi:hypothetical protein